MQTTRQRIVLAALAIHGGLVAFHTVSAQDATGFIQATSETVRFKLENVLGAPNDREIWVDNHSTLPVRITGVQLTDCENVRVTCTSYPASTKVAPGDRRLVYRVRPKVPGSSMRFRFQVSWRPDSAAFTEAMRMAQGMLQSARSASPEPADTAAERRLLEQQLASSRPRPLTPEEVKSESARLEAMLGRGPRKPAPPPPLEPDLSPGEILSLGDRIVAWRVDPDSVVLKRGDVMLLGQIRIVALDSAGTRIGRFRGQYRFRMDGESATLAPPDTVVAVNAGRTIIQIAPGDALNAGRTKPLGVLRFTVVVP